MACESIYWTNISDDIEKQITNCSTCLDFQQKQTKEKIIHHKIPAQAWEIVGTDMLTLHKGNYLCIVDYHSTSAVIKKMEDLSPGSFILTCKTILSEYGLLKKIMSGSGDSCISDKFKTFCRSLNIEQAFSSS